MEDGYEHDADIWSGVAESCDSVQRHNRASAGFIPRRKSASLSVDHLSGIASLHQSMPAVQHAHSITPELRESLSQRMSSGVYGAMSPVYGIKAATQPASLRRLRKGKETPDAVIDLHGLNTDSAFETLRSQITLRAAQGARMLLIITGKGQGILKSALPSMLSDESIAPFVVCYEQASAAHGGSGAFYAVLRRRIPTGM